MESDISEFSFGFAVVNEICQKLPKLGFSASAAPFFPNLRQEKLRPYDVKIPTRGVPLFLQFKRSDKMFRRMKAKADEWDLYKTPYFRVNLYKRFHSDQHKNLQELAKKELYVCYVSPLFFKPFEFDQAYSNQQVVNESIFVHVNRLPPLPDDQTHYFTFLRGDDLRFWSKPVAIQGKFTGDFFLDKLVSVFKNKEALRKMDSEYLYDLRASILKIIGIDLPSQIKKQERDLIDDIVYLCRVYLGCEVIFIGLFDEEKPNNGSQHLSRIHFITL